MSLPKELLDQLLTGYLDDALTADERVRVEQLLESNAEIADELGQLRDLRQSLQVLSKVDSDIKLDQGFADRVLGAAVARAREEGLADDHPLISLAEQPSTSPAATAPRSSSWRAAAILVGLAASIVIAVFVLRPQTETDPVMIAKSETTPADPQDIPLTRDALVPDETPASPRVEPGPMLAENGQPSLDTVASSEATPSVGRSDVDDARSVDADPSLDPGTGSATQDSVAAVDAPPMTTEREAAVTTVPDPMAKLGAILVVDVRRTEAGRANDAVAKAMSAAEIAPASRKEVTEQIAGFVADNVDDDDSAEGASVLYLQLPGKQFDLFYQQLWADEEGIESVRMTIAMGAPVMQLVDSVRPDPTTVVHEAAAYELFSQSGAVDQLISELDELPFPAATRSGVATSLLGSGPDVQAQVLVLVR